MHSLALVITPGSRSSAYRRADRLLCRSAPIGVDYWGAGGRFSARLSALGLLPDSDAWPEAIPVSRIPAPVPPELMPTIVVTPRGAWFWEPLDEDEATQAQWLARLNRIIGKYSGGHTAVLMDVHY